MALETRPLTELKRKEILYYLFIHFFLGGVIFFRHGAYIAASISIFLSKGIAVLVLYKLSYPNICINLIYAGL